MKLSLLIGGAIGYVVGARAGRERYEDIVRIARRVVGSQTVQTTAGVLQGRLDGAARNVRATLGGRLAGALPRTALGAQAAPNGHRP